MELWTKQFYKSQSDVMAKKIKKNRRQNKYDKKEESMFVGWLLLPQKHTLKTKVASNEHYDHERTKKNEAEEEVHVIL